MAKRKNKSRKGLYTLFSLLALIIILAVVGITTGIIGKKQALDVEAAKASTNTIVEKVSASGMIQPVTEVKLSPDVAGEIIQLNVREGDSVGVGAFLAKIRPDNWINARERAEASLNQQRANLISAKASLSKAEANMERAEAEYARQKELWEEKVISAAEWQQAKQSFEAARNDLKAAEQQVIASGYIVRSSEASVEEAQENVRLTNVIAPMSGIISKLSVEKGERVVGTQQMAGTEMMRIADLDSMEVRVDVNENDIIRVSLGDTALIDVDAYSHLGRNFIGVVTAIANSANDKSSPDAVTEFEVRVTMLKNSYNDLVNEGNRFPFRPGMTASVEIITERKENILTVPLSAVTTRNVNKKNDEKDTNTSLLSGDDVKEVVFALKDGKAQMKQVTTGISDYENIHITDGLEAGEEIITGPFLVVSKRLNDGDEVTVEKEEDKKSFFVF